jgi:redox-sensing transcriptional repressor
MTKPNQRIISISRQALQRMPLYIQYLKKLQSSGADVIASPAVAEALGFGDVQVRKDLSAVSSIQGIPKRGFPIAGLIADIEHFLGYNSVRQAILIGSGYLGRALLSYKGFEQYGLDIVMAFDNDETLIGQQISGKHILPISQLTDMCRRMNIHIGIITVPAGQAQIVCDQLVAGGVLAIWNFAPVHLCVPEHILVQDENMAASLALLSQHLKARIDTIR